MKIIKIITWLSDLVSKKRKYDFEIKLSGRVNFIENPQDFFDKFNTIFLDDQATKRIKIDITDAAFIYPKVLFFIISLKETLKGRQEVARVRRNQAACCARDEGRSLGVGRQGQASNYFATDNP